MSCYLLKFFFSFFFLQQQNTTVKYKPVKTVSADGTDVCVCVWLAQTNPQGQNLYLFF